MESRSTSSSSVTRLEHFRSIEEIPGAEALEDRVDSYYHSREGLLLAEQTNPGAISYLSVTSEAVRSITVPVITATPQSRWVMGRPDRVHSIARASQQITGPLSGVESAQLLPSLVCGGRQMGFSAPLPSMHRAGEERYSSDIHRLSVLLEDEAAARGCASVSWPFVTAPKLRSALRDAGYSEYQSGVWHTLDSAHGFAGYLARLSGRRRRSVLAERRMLRREGYDCEFRAVDKGLVPQLARLEFETLARHGVTWSPEISSYLLGVTSEHFGENVVASFVRRGRTIVAFCVFVRHGRALWPRHVGVDRADRRSAEALSEAMFYQSIEGAYDSNCDVVNLGFGSDAYKRSHGTAASPHYSLTKQVSQRRSRAT